MSRRIHSIAAGASIVVIALFNVGCEGQQAKSDSTVKRDKGSRPDVARYDMRTNDLLLADRVVAAESMPAPDLKPAGDQKIVDKAVNLGDMTCTTVELEAEEDRAVKQSAGWMVFAGSVLHQGQGLEGGAGTTLTFGFKGTGLTVYHETGPNRGTFEVSIDSGTPVSVNTTATSFNFQVPSTVASGLPLTSHTAVLTCLTLICAIDYFAIHTCK
jgi:hypothetical protein